MQIKLKKHIFCLLQIDENTILCGQLQGYLDLIRISDGKILLSQDLKHTTGNIISMVKTMGRPNEIVLATQKGVFFASLGKGAHGLRQAQVQQLDKTAHFMYGRSSNSLDPNNAVSVFAQDPSKAGALSNINETSTSDMNRPVANIFAPTQSSGADLNLQFQSLNQSNSIVNSKENPML